jgi:hypothetical protein
LHFLVHAGVLRDDDQFRLAHPHWFVQISRMRWSAYSNADANSATNTNSHTSRTNWFDGYGRFQ